MDELEKTLMSLKVDNLDSNEDTWTELKQQLDTFCSRFTTEALDAILVSSPNLPKHLTTIGSLLSRTWSSVDAPAMNVDCILFSATVAFLRLLKMFDSPSPRHHLEKASNDWMRKTLTTFTDGASVREENEELLAVALVESDIVSDQWIAEVARPTLTRSLEEMQAGSVFGLWSVPSFQLRKVLSWACCIAKSAQFRHDLEPIIEALEPGKGALSDECYVLYRHLRETLLLPSS